MQALVQLQLLLGLLVQSCPTYRGIKCLAIEYESVAVTSNVISCGDVFVIGILILIATHLMSQMIILC